MPRVRPHLLGRHALAAHARGACGALKDVLRRLLAGELTEDEALGELRSLQLEELGGRARLDLASSARVLRQGFAPEPLDGKVGLLTAGTSDVAVAEEALMVIEACGLGTRLEADLGVAGLHRFIGPLEQVLEWGADVLVVAAGMDGVLPGLVAGLIDVPVIGLPVSTGYGRGGAGEGALGTMLQSCSTGLVVVNIDNGVGAGAAAVLIAARAASARSISAGAAVAPRRSPPRSRPAARPRG